VRPTPRSLLCGGHKGSAPVESCLRRQRGGMVESYCGGYRVRSSRWMSRKLRSWRKDGPRRPRRPSALARPVGPRGRSWSLPPLSLPVPTMSPPGPLAIPRHRLAIPGSSHPCRPHRIPIFSPPRPDKVPAASCLCTGGRWSAPSRFAEGGRTWVAAGLGRRDGARVRRAEGGVERGGGEVS
jgi:hypothetical protein